MSYHHLDMMNIMIKKTLQEILELNSDDEGEVKEKK